ncbi:MAG: ATP-grasp domain-containing protein [Deltaproteobacteria bacterium]|nr:MAG: ATP-grasp domain-containing protein [Deltaproteobacteria bacterium]
MRNVIFTAPFPMETTMLFARALRGLSNIRLLGLFQQAPQGADRALFDDIVTVPNAMDPAMIVRGARYLQEQYGEIHRLLGILEDLQVQVAIAREELGIYGPSVEVTQNFRDKARMKAVFRQHGLPCAASRTVTSAADAYALAEEVGYPLILKPPAGAGSRATYKVEDRAQLDQALAEVRPGPGRTMLAEEFLAGREFTYETVSIGGTPVFESIGRYYPGPLDVVRNDWMQWIVVLPRDISSPEYNDAREAGRKAIKALGLCEGMTHMEWFRRPDGSMAIGEIAARPPGAQIVKLMSYAHDQSLHRAWARAVVDREHDGPFERRYAVGIAFLRGTGRGRVARIDGLDEAQKKMGHLVVETQLPKVGMPKAGGYEGEGFAIVRHPDTTVVEQAVLDLVRTVKIRYA